MSRIQLRKDIAEKLLANNMATLRIAIKMNCSQQNIQKLIKANSPKLCLDNYAVVIKETLKINQKEKIYDEFI